jgi:hypothetical protein
LDNSADEIEIFNNTDTALTLTPASGISIISYQNKVSIAPRAAGLVKQYQIVAGLNVHILIGLLS